MTMQHKTYLIEYKIYDKLGVIIKQGKMRAKNKTSELEAKCDFEDFLKKKYPDFDKLYISSCKEEGPLDSLFGDFGDIFGNNNNPFGGNPFKF